jgi:hypothetical protein
MLGDDVKAVTTGGVGKVLRLPLTKRMAVIGGAVITVLILAGIATVLILNRPAALPETPAGGNLPAAGGEAAVLPQTRRDNGQIQGLGELIRDPFATPLKLTGIATGGAGGSMAIVESGGTTYIVSTGDAIDDFWSVVNITHDTVSLSSEQGEVTLRLQHRVLEEPDGGAAEEDI